MNLSILETTDFSIYAPKEPHHSRENGGHIVITPKQRFSHRDEMPLDLASKLMQLTMLVGEATTTVLRKKGLDVVRINYQDNGNWAYKEPEPTPHLHIHLYIRTSNEKHPAGDPRFQAFPDALVFPDRKTGYYDDFKPLTDEDCDDINREIKSLLETEKYQQLKSFISGI
jgi:diadenosine tetraphosphate (Ap4A) HIT family hydrolase